MVAFKGDLKFNLVLPQVSRLPRDALMQVDAIAVSGNLDTKFFVIGQSEQPVEPIPSPTSTVPTIIPTSAPLIINWTWRMDRTAEGVKPGELLFV